MTFPIPCIRALHTALGLVAVTATALAAPGEWKLRIRIVRPNEVRVVNPQYPTAETQVSANGDTVTGFGLAFTDSVLNGAAAACGTSGLRFERYEYSGDWYPEVEVSVDTEAFASIDLKHSNSSAKIHVAAKFYSNLFDVTDADVSLAAATDSSTLVELGLTVGTPTTGLTVTSPIKAVAGEGHSEDKKVGFHFDCKCPQGIFWFRNVSEGFVSVWALANFLSPHIGECSCKLSGEVRVKPLLLVHQNGCP
jgi:hypothetical protein